MLKIYYVLLNPSNWCGCKKQVITNYSQLTNMTLFEFLRNSGLLQNDCKGISNTVYFFNKNEYFSN